MTDDFVTRLGVALRDAADREEHRGAPWRAAATARARIPRLLGSPVPATVVAALALALAVYGLASFRSSDTAPAGPKVVAKLTPAAALDQTVAGFGSVWTADTDAQALLRMDPASRRVTARIPLNGRMQLATGKGAVWVGLAESNGFRLLRIDPRSDRIVARLRLHDVPGGWGSGGVPVIVGPSLWVLSAEAATRIDPATGRAIRTVVTAHNGYLTRSWAVAEGDLWVQTSDGRLQRLDGATGKREATSRVPDGSLVGDFAMNGLYIVDQTTLSRVDPRNLRPLWRTTIPSIGTGVAADGRLWVETPDRQGDRVLTVDPRDGHVIDGVHVGEFGAQSMARVGSEVWMTTAGGDMVILGG